MHHTRIVNEAGFFQFIFPFLYFGFGHRAFVRRLTEWELSLPTFNLVGNCEVIARVFRYRPAEVVSSLVMIQCVYLLCLRIFSRMSWQPK